MIRESSNERIASTSVTKEKGKEKQVSVYPGTRQPQGRKENIAVPGAQQPQAHGNDEIVTLPPPFSSDVLIEQNRGELLSEEVLHKLFHETCHGQMTSGRGSCIGNIYTHPGGGCR